MKQLRVSIVGAGKRVIETALPAFAAASESFVIHGVFARKERTLSVAGAKLPVRTLASFSDSDLLATDVFYVAVGKGSIGAVLTALTAFDVAAKTLWIDTPVLLWKQIRYLENIERFEKAEVPEDCIALPWYDVVEKLRAQRGLGPTEYVTFLHSAYKYHGLAMAKALLGDDRIVSGSVRRGGAERVDSNETISRGGPDERTRTLRFARGGHATVYEPRDYGKGHVLLGWKSLGLSDVPRERRIGSSGKHELEITMSVERGRVVGFHAGEASIELDDAERELQVFTDPELGLTARMEDWKRIGFLRLLRRLARGEPGYSALAGIDDSLVDWQLDKFGFYRRNPLTTIDRRSARIVLGAVSRIVG